MKDGRIKQYKNGSKGKNQGQKKKSHRGHGCLSLVSVVCCCQVEVSATGWSLVQKSPTECGVSKKCVIVKPRKMRRPKPPRGCRAIEKKIALKVETIRTYYFTIKFATCFGRHVCISGSTDWCIVKGTLFLNTRTEVHLGSKTIIHTKTFRCKK
jgi:hypothetical protein